MKESQCFHIYRLCRGDPFPVYVTQDGSSASAAGDETFDAVPDDFVITLETGTSDEVRSDGLAPHTFLADGLHMDGAGVPAHELALADGLHPLSLHVASYAERVVAVPFVDAVADALLLREVAVGQADIGMQVPQPVIHRPADDVHEGGVTQGLRAPSQLEFDLALVQGRMACPAQRHEVVRGVPSGLPRLDVVDVQNRVLALSVAGLAFVAVTVQHILPGVPETVPGALLVLLSLYVGVLQKLSVDCYDRPGNL